MKKKRKLLLWLIPLLLVFLLAAVIVGILLWQKDNVAAVYVAMTSTAEKLEDDWAAHQQAEQQFLEDHQVSFTPPTAEQNEALMNGLTSAEEVKQSLGLAAPTDNPANDTTAAPPVEPPANPSVQPLTSSQLIDECVRKLYSIRIDLIARLGALRADAINTWEALSENERTDSRKAEIIFDGLLQCSDLEVETDDMVDALLNAYREKLSALGEDTAVIDQLWLYYCDDKATTKAYYLNQYL